MAGAYSGLVSRPSRHARAQLLLTASWCRSPACGKPVPSAFINAHLDTGCSKHRRGPAQSTLSFRGASSTSTGAHASSPAPSTFGLRTGTGKRKASSSSGKQASQAPVVLDDDDDDEDENERKPSTSSSEHRASVAAPPRKRAKTATERLRAVKPLADRVRPTELDEFIGQEQVVGPGTMLRSLIESDKLSSIVLWGPPGVGKTVSPSNRPRKRHGLTCVRHSQTIARVIAKHTKSSFKELSATSTSTADVRKVFEDAYNLLKLTGQRTILFLDEIQVRRLPSAQVAS